MSRIFPHRTALLSVAGNTRPRIGVLALQGDVREHVAMLHELGADVVEVRLPQHLSGIQGLIIPGGESSVMDKLSRIFGLRDPLVAAISAGLPVLGTCAGLIMLADSLEDAISGQQTLGGLDITVRRNAFGAQVDSFEAQVTIEGIAGPPLEVAFIRAPSVTTVGPKARVIASLQDGTIVGVIQDSLVGIAFHPEITGDDRVHRLFLGMVSTRAFALATVSGA
jgi:5'-phosphate synthase pdxT subunit